MMIEIFGLPNNNFNTFHSSIENGCIIWIPQMRASFWLVLPILANFALTDALSPLNIVIYYYSIILLHIVSKNVFWCYSLNAIIYYDANFPSLIMLDALLWCHLPTTLDAFIWRVAPIMKSCLFRIWIWSSCVLGYYLVRPI